MFRSIDDIKEILSYNSLNSVSTGWAVDLLCLAVLTDELTLTGAEEHAVLSQWEAFSSEVREELTALSVLAELPTEGQVLHPGDGGEEVVRVHQAGLAIRPAGVNGELGQGKGRAEQQQPQHGQTVL